MASAFASGFKMGGDMFDSAERNRLVRERLEMEKAQEARNAEEQGLRISAARRVNEATDALTNAQTLGLQVPGAQQNNEGLQRQSFRQFEIGQQNADAAGTEAPAYVAPTGLQQTYRPAGDLDINRLQSTLAAARGDVQGMEALRLGRRQMGVQDALDRAAKMPDNELADLFPQLNTRAMAGLPIYDAGDVIGKDGKPTGYRTIRTVGKDGKPNMIELSPAKQREMAAAYMLMQGGFGAEGLAKLSAIDKDLADTVAKYNQSVAGVVNSNNQTTRFVNADEKDRLEIGIRQQELKVRQGAAAAQASYYDTLKTRANRPQSSDLREFVDDNGRVTLVDITGLPRGEDGTIPLPAGLRPRTAKPQFSPKEYAETVKLYTEAGFPIEDARMLADKDYGRGPQSNVDERLTARNDQVAKGRQPIVVRPGEVIARDPSVPIRGPVDSFVREAVRQPMWRGGGLQYVYRDPVTNRTYTIDEYNKLLSE